MAKQKKKIHQVKMRKFVRPHRTRLGYDFICPVCDKRRIVGALCHIKIWGEPHSVVRCHICGTDSRFLYEDTRGEPVVIEVGKNDEPCKSAWARTNINK